MDSERISSFTWQYAASPIMRLPDEILSQILPRLPIEDLLLAAPLVCRRWKLLARKPECFKDLDLRDWTRKQVLALSIRDPCLKRNGLWQPGRLDDASDGTEDSEDLAGPGDARGVTSGVNWFTSPNARGRSIPGAGDKLAGNEAAAAAPAAAADGDPLVLGGSAAVMATNGSKGRAPECGSDAALQTNGAGTRNAVPVVAATVSSVFGLIGAEMVGGGSDAAGKPIETLEGVPWVAEDWSSRFVDTLLQRLAIYGMGHVEVVSAWFCSNRGLAALAATRPRLTRIELWGLTTNIDKGLILLAQCSPELTHLTVHDLHHGPGCYLAGCDHGENPTAITDKALNAISQSCTRLLELHLAVAANMRVSSWEEEWVLNSSAIMSLIKSSQKLRRLTLDLSGLRAAEVVDILTLLGTHSPDLVYLNFSVFCLSENLGPSIPLVLRLLRKACPNLTGLRLRLGNGDFLSNTGVIAPHFRGMVAGRALRELAFTKMPWFRDRHLTGLVTQLPSLEALDVSFTSVQDQGIMDTMNSCPRLTRLLASKCEMTDAAVEVIAAKGYRLKELRLTDTTITNRAISLLARGVCTKLEIVSLVPGNQGNHEPGLLSQSNFENFMKKNCALKEVCLRVDSFPPRVMYKEREQKQNFDLFFASLAQRGQTLQGLVLYTEFMVGIKPDKFFKKLLEFAASCPGLKSLGIVGFRKLSEDMSSRLALAWPLLEHVSIINCSRLSWKVVRNIAVVCKHLKTVDCSGSISVLCQDKWRKLQKSMSRHVEILGMTTVEWRRLRVTVPEHMEAECRYSIPGSVRSEGMLCGHFADRGLCWLED